MNISPIHLTDAYKQQHQKMYPAGTTEVYSNLTARSSRVSGVNHVVFFGLQYFLKKYLIEEFNHNFFHRPKGLVIRQYKRRMRGIFGVDPDVSHLEQLYDLGYLPLEIKALPEGSLVPFRVPLLTVRNTHPSFAWITNFIETMLSSTVWLPITSATTAFRYHQLVKKYAEETSDCMDGVLFQCHDFSMRGMGAIEAALTSAAGHLLSFTGSDTLPAVDFLETYYGANSDTEVVAQSIPASEHACISLGGKEGEYETYRRLICDVYPEGFISIVSDTWDYWKVLNETIRSLKDVIKSRPGRVVIRGDSGDPVKITCGEPIPVFDSLDNAKAYLKNEVRQEAIGENSDIGWYTKLCQVGEKYYKLHFDICVSYDCKGFKWVEYCDHKQTQEWTPTVEEKGTISLLWEIFGGTINSKGYKELHPSIGFIYGDSITYERADAICAGLKAKGFASTNAVFGVGSFSYQHTTRDTYGLAMKATFAKINGVDVAIYKDPKTDNGVKRSARGRLMVYPDIDKHEDGIWRMGDYKLFENVTEEQEKTGCLKTVFLNGELTRDWSLQEIRERVRREGSVKP